VTLLAALFVIGPGLGAQIERRAEVAWADLRREYEAAARAQLSGPRGPIHLRAGELPAGHAGWSAPGLVELRAPATEHALRHELAHQLLFWACPAASDDRLFHEAFALSVSGELSTWTADRYLPLSKAAQLLRERGLDTRGGRNALARVLSETRDGSLSRALLPRLRACGAGAPWAAPLSPEELADADADPPADAAIALSRHSGEVLLVEGEVRAPLPFGSALKPFVVAGAPSAPRLRGCDAALMEAGEALARSCNEWFLAWSSMPPPSAPARPSAKPPASVAAPFGEFGGALRALGLSRLPEEMAEAIGIRATLRLSPWAMAQAYRLLAEARPDVLAALRQTAVIGTLSKLPVSAGLAGVAAKTGTVRDSRSRPRLGWIVLVDDDAVVVLVRAGKAPRTFAADAAALLARVRALPGIRAARVQALGLLPEAAVEARCPGLGLSLGKPSPLGPRFRPLRDLLPALCLGHPWRVRFPGTPAEGRDYAGVFTLSPPLPSQHAPGRPRSEREMRARRGSDFIFRTTALRYAAGVVAAEAADLRGEARAALLRVAAHNEAHSRHPGRPVCDTTHCQAFLGTVAPRATESAALGRPPLRWRRWLLFSAGGSEPWEELRPAAALGDHAALRFDKGRAHWVSAEGTPQSAPCEALRGALRLPSCPERAVREGDAVRFFGRGRGHGEGLDVAAAGASAAGQEEILEGAYGGGDG